MKWVFSRINRTFSGLLLLNFLILIVVTVSTYYFSLKQVEQNNMTLLSLTNQKIEARKIWNDLQEVNIEIQDAFLKGTPTSPHLENNVNRIKIQLKNLAQSYPSTETDSYIRTSTNLLNYYEKVLIPLTKNQRLATRYTDFSTMQRILKNADLVIPLQSTSTGTQRSVLDTMYFFTTTRQSVDQYISSIQAQELQVHQELTNTMRKTLWMTLTSLVLLFFMLNSWTFQFMQRLTSDLVQLIKHTKNPYAYATTPLVNRHDEIGVLGKAMHNMMTMLAYQQSETQATNLQLSDRNHELSQSLYEKKESETQLKLQTDFARRLLESNAPHCLQGVLRDLARPFAIPVVWLTLMNTEETILYQQDKKTKDQIPEAIRKAIEQQAMMQLVPKFQVYQGTRLYVIPLLDSGESSPFALLTFVDTTDLAHKKILRLANILSLGILRIQHIRTLNEDKLYIQQIIDSLREAVIYINFPSSRLIHNGTLTKMFPELRDLPDTLHDVDSIMNIFHHLFIDQELLNAYVTQLRFHLQNGTTMDSQDFEVTGERHVRVYTEFLPDRKGIIFVLSERTMEVEATQKEQAFISMMSHELRTPLASIEGFSEIMIHRQLSDEKQLKYLKTVRGEAQRLGKLVTAFLDYQRLSHKKDVYTFESFDLSSLVQEVTDWMNVSAPSHNIVFDTLHSSCPIQADREKIRQLLTNLIGNAIKYSPTHPQIDVLLDCTEEEIVLTVSDNGLGIPKEDLPNLFESYYRVELKQHKHIQGTGLGLLICKEIVEAHQGQISVSSELGVGTDFLVRLPKT